MNRFRFPFTLPRPLENTQPRLVNSFRDAAVNYENEALAALPLVRELIDWQLNHERRTPGQSGPTGYDLLVLGLLLPADGGVVVMSWQQHQQLTSYLRLQLYQLVRDRKSPFSDVSPTTLYQALTEVNHVVANYTSIKKLWQN